MKQLTDIARRHGLLDAAFTQDLSRSRYTTAFDESVRWGWLGDMDYLVRTRDERVDPHHYIPWARWVLVFLYSYASSSEEKKSASEKNAFIAGYAQVDFDYHKVLRDRGKALARDVFPEGARTHVVSDASAVPERELAVRAGLGFLGKNGLLIHPQYGSKILLGVVFSDTAPLGAVASLARSYADLCGSCNACLEACPTQALEAPRRLNATRCLAYWTVETKEEKIPVSLQENQGSWVFGCDVCQDVCPWNRFSSPTPDRIAPERQSLEVATVLASRESAETFFRLRGKSPMRRLSFKKWLRNTAFLARNASS